MPFEADDLSFGDIILVPFPFTNQASVKQRPAVVISSATYNTSKPDIILMAITSQLRPTASIGELMVKHWQESGLLKPSAIKPVIATIERSLIIKKLGALGVEEQAALRVEMAAILG
jgi:mRNA interferase MazF